MIEILTSGPPNSIQDLGRTGHIDAGVGRSGAMDRLSLAVANALLGNPAGSAAIEVAFFPFRLRFGADTVFAVTGADTGASLDGAPLPPNWMRAARAGQTLALGVPRRGARAYVTFRGGIDVPVVLGSRATDQKAGFGGLEGRGLSRKDRLPLLDAPDCSAMPAAGFGASLAGLEMPPPNASGARLALRVLPAAEYPLFTEDARRTFFETEWIVTQEASRAGYRLGGPALGLKRPVELLSHGVVPGVVQVPPSGLPIIQLADANTCGGYPKIATVIGSDLWRLSQAPIGARLKFVETTREAAVEALRVQAGALADLRRFAAKLTCRS